MKINIQKSEKNKWYDNPIWVYIWVVLFFPVGLYGLYKSNTISKGIKYTFYGVCSVLLIGTMCTKKQPNNAVVQQSSETQQTQVEAPPPPPKFAEKGRVSFDANGNKVTPQFIFWVVGQDISDTPLKTQVSWHVAVEGKYNKDELKELLTYLYEKATELRGFKHYNPATHYQILIYENEKKAKRELDWLVLLNKIREQPLDYRINDLEWINK